MNEVFEMKDLERIIEDVNASMAMEGMPLTEEDKARMRYCAGDKKKTDQVVAELMRKHSVNAEDVHEQKL
ncbi:MAG: antitoxin VbhA family protein [Caulobacteraceae bacterium]